MACGSCGGRSFMPTMWVVTDDQGEETKHVSRTQALVYAARHGGVVTSESGKPRDLS